MEHRDPMTGARGGHATVPGQMERPGSHQEGKRISLNNNRNNNSNNNRRRGRSNRPQGGGGGGNQMNRIDSRARGNAPQMLDKYKKLAQDAQHNGDRVQAEYYLQFADHYFRVISDNKSRQDDQRGGRRDERDANDNDDGDGDEDDFDGRRQQQQPQAPQRDNRGDRNRNRIEQNSDHSRDDPRSDNRNENRGDGRDDERSESNERNQSAEFEPTENPFVRGKRPPRGRNPRDQDTEDQGGEIDAAVLPPSISADDEDEKPRRRAPRRRKSGDGESETLKAVG